MSGVADLPVAILILLSHRLGRKPLTIASLLLGTVTLITSAFLNAYINTDSKWR